MSLGKNNTLMKSSHLPLASATTHEATHAQMVCVRLDKGSLKNTKKITNFPNSQGKHDLIVVNLLYKEVVIIGFGPIP